MGGGEMTEKQIRDALFDLRLFICVTTRKR